MAEATIDELRIEVEAESAQAASNLDNLIKKLEKLRPTVESITGGEGLSKLRNQISKLTKTTQQLQNVSGFDKITQLVNAVKSLNGLNAVNTEQVNSVVSSMRKLRNVIQQMDAMPAFDVSKIQQMSTALQPFEGANTQGFADFLRSLQRLPKISEKLDGMDFDGFAQQMERFAQAIGPAAQELERASSAFERLPESTREYIGSAASAASASDNTNRAVNNLGNTFGNLRVRTAAVVATLGRLTSRFAECLKTSNQFVENLNLFTVTMGESADEAYRFAEAVNDALGIDTSDWVRYQGFFQSIGKGFGIATQKADLMSQNLTQLSYDLSSFYNTSVDEAYNKVVSGISGELEPLRRYGFALDEATLKQVAYEKGITQSIETMTQAQKAQLRYVAIMEQAGNIGVLGDMSRTIDTSANQLRILEARLQQFARAVGNMLMPILSQFLPYMTAFIQLLTEGAQAIAEFLGFELPKIDLNTSSVTSGYEDIADATNAATEATEKFKGSLAGVDQLNIIGSKNDSGAGSGNGLNYDLDIDLPSYDFLNGVESKTKEIFEGMKQAAQALAPYLETILSLVINIAAAYKLNSVLTAFKSGKGGFAGIGKFFKGEASGLAKFSAGLAGGVASMLLWKNAAKDMALQTDKWGTSLGVAIGGTAVIGGVLTRALGPVGLLVTGIGGLAGVFLGLNDAVAEMNDTIAKNSLFRNGGTKVSEIADSFSAWADAAAELNNQTINKYAQLEQYGTTIADLVEQFNGVDLENLTPEDAADLKQPFEELVGYLESEFKERIGLAADSVRTAFTNLGIDAAITGEVESALKQLEIELDDNLSESQKVVSRYLEEGVHTPEQQEEFTRNYNYVLDSAKRDTVEYQDVQNAIKDLQSFDLSNVNLEGDEEFQAAIAQMSASYQSYIDSAKQLRDEELANIEELRKQVEIDFQYSDITGMTDAEYQSNLELLEALEKAANLNYNASVDEIKSQIQPIQDAINKELTDAADIYARNQLEWIKTTSGGTPFLDVESELSRLSQNWLDGNAFYQDWKVFLEEIGKVQTVEVDLSYDPNGEYAFLYEALQRTQPHEIKVQVTADIDEKLSPFIGGTAVDEKEIYSAIDSYINGSIIDTTPKTTSISNDSSALDGESIGAWWSGVFGAATNSVLEENPINITLHSTVELDGDAVGEAQENYNYRKTFVTNGR